MAPFFYLPRHDLGAAEIVPETGIFRIQANRLLEIGNCAGVITFVSMLQCLVQQPSGLLCDGASGEAAQNDKTREQGEVSARHLETVTAP